MRFHLNTKTIIDNLTGKNKSFVKRVAKHQLEKYGNDDIFSASVSTDEVDIWFGDYGINFYFRDGKVIDTLGNGQGHRYHASLQECACELNRRAVANELSLC